jgi:hypothetical protein
MTTRGVSGERFVYDLNTLLGQLSQPTFVWEGR